MIVVEKKSSCWYKDVCLADSSNCANCIKFMEMQYLMENSNLPKSKQQPIRLKVPNEDINAYERLADIKDNIVDFVSNGNNLYIGSYTTGNGKTSWAIKLMHKYFDEVWAGNGFRPRALFIHLPTFLLKCKDFNNIDESFEQLKKLIPVVDLVVWDDIAGVNISSYDFSQLLMYIDARTFAGKSNIFTANCETYERLQELLGGKIASRVWTSNSEAIIFKGGDRR